MKIVGCMHYNPHSIKTASQYITELGESNTLGSVVLESCNSRWSRTLKKQPKGSLRRNLLDNEMQAAYELGIEFDRPIILGDQDIDTTNDRLKAFVILFLFLLQLLPGEFLASPIVRNCICHYS